MPTVGNDFDYAGGSSTVVDKEAFVKEVASNIPAINVEKGESFLRLERGTENLVKYSENISVSEWLKTATTVSLDGGVVSPSGKLGVYHVAATETMEEHRINDSVADPLVAPAVYTASFYIKSNNHTNVVILLGDGADYITNLNLETLEYEVVGAQILQFDVKRDANGWLRVEAIGNIQIGITPLVRVYLANAAGDTVYKGDGVSGFYFWGAQMELGYGGTSYIPTSGSTIVKSSKKIGLVSDVFTTLRGTLIFTSRLKSDISGAENRCIRLGDTNNSFDGIRIQFANQEDRILVQYRDGINTIEIGLFLVENLREFNTFAFSYESGSFKFFMNGIKIGENNSTIDEVDMNINWLRSFRTGEEEIFNGDIKKILFYNQVLSEEEISSIK
jgi:hypothetical protein